MDYKKIFKSQKLRFFILRMLFWVPDSIMLKIQYKVKMNRCLDLKKPKRFTEKIQHYKMYYRNAEMLPCTDKYQVRQFVESRVGNKYLNELLGVYADATEINWSELPAKFVLKTTDGGGGENVIICKDKSTLEINETIKRLNSWRNKGSSSLSREWAYEQATSLIIAEAFLENIDDPENSIDDYKFFCFNGKVECLVVDIDRYIGHKRNFYDNNWNNLNIATDCLCFDKEKSKPDNFEEMVDVAEKLSEGFPFVRVDLYNINGRILFGELTFYPWSGYVQFTPDEFDFALGSKFRLDY
ncbi:teichuronopeptide biosynthesis TupA-like protein [Dysgonomonas alginatilytica]|uniref:Teichuronopeptide biosynthesis TupA-like protein n=1 Tax=Dysgonomonas alginatilytica TaxID=1605892 RepID=A0A2V3PLL5_9BACT|nr:ATP-grasp fold amidoligase family protein [Dysgonomonas alginatilytica]PXV62183.1 teichuronopeptide biosynthesis TupA-like protein [Dysgonomonas alginatilytica]